MFARTDSVCAYTMRTVSFVLRGVYPVCAHKKKSFFKLEEILDVFARVGRDYTRATYEEDILLVLKRADHF